MEDFRNILTDIFKIANDISSVGFGKKPRNAYAKIVQ